MSKGLVCTYLPNFNESCRKFKTDRLQFRQIVSGKYRLLVLKYQNRFDFSVVHRKINGNSIGINKIYYQNIALYIRKNTLRKETS